jgi:hypothetical protein
MNHQVAKAQSFEKKILFLVSLCLGGENQK